MLFFSLTNKFFKYLFALFIETVLKILIEVYD